MSASVVRLVDVSAFTPAVDWKRAKAEGYVGAIVRASHGNDKNAPGKGIDKDGRDMMFRKHVTGAQAAGLSVGAYHVAFPLPHLDPHEQARHAYEMADTLGEQTGEIDPVLDLEWPSRETAGEKPRASWRRWGCTGEQILVWGLRYMEEAARLWKTTPIIYTYPWFWQTCISDEGVTAEMLELFRPFRFWLAGGPQYINGNGWIPKSMNDKACPTAKPWGKPMIWQHDGNGGLHIGAADVDANIMLASDFNVVRGVAE